MRLIERGRFPMSDQKEKILQFGAGKFLRAFLDLFVQEAAEAGENPGRVVVVQSTPGARAGDLAARGCSYHVLLRGISGGEQVDSVCRVDSISRALVAGESWQEVLDLARSEDLELIVSNTTEKGYEVDETDGPDSSPPSSFPAKLLQVLQARFEAGGRGVMVLPCELIEHNASTLRGIVLGLGESWGLPLEFLHWAAKECSWHENLVDRIVTGRPEAHPLLEEDPLLIACEPFALFAIESCGGRLDLFSHPAIRVVDDVTPYALRKVRILNGAHTALVAKALPAGFETVRAAVEDSRMGSWLHDLLFQEIVPTVRDRVEDAEGFAHDVLERFRNPFVDHRLEDIALHHEDKLRVRLLPTCEEYAEQTGKDPVILTELLRSSA
ncbi:MAG: tagaturonate reductase [Planctomycetota bacterium]|nr:tagaturonate reductase [Planctomycetota bacterium]